MLQFNPYRKSVWRLIELQSQPSTQKITDTLEEQALLEDILERSKPEVPEECLSLDYQMRSPFRYGRYPQSSRFRRVGRTLGVYYASEEPITAALEAAWYRVRFFNAAIDLPELDKTLALTAIAVLVSTPFSVDLRKASMSEAGNWTDPDDYSDCLNLADDVREAKGELIVYQSVRHPQNEANVAVLTCNAFEQPKPVEQQTWHVHIKSDRVILRCETTRQSYEFVVGEKAFIDAA